MSIDGQQPESRLARETEVRMRRDATTLIGWALTAMALVAAAGCGSGNGAQAQGGSTVFGVTPAGQLVRFNRTTPATVTTIGPISGLAGGESVAGMDFRPFTDQLYAVTTANKLYRINTTNGNATPIGAQAFTPGLSGSVAGMDFSAESDRLRIVTAAEQNLRINPDTGAVLVIDTALAYAAGDPNFGNTPDVAAAAYTNNANPPPSSATLYVIDTSRDVLARVGGVGGVPSPNGGALSTIGPLGVDASSGPTSLDITGSGTALAVIQVGGTRGLYSVNLNTGAVTLIGALGADVSEIAITL
jgi:hypothetical protein